MIGAGELLSAHGSAAHQAVTLFILAHPDDELAVSPILDRLVLERRPLRLIYLTNGASRGVSAAVREAESIAALAHLGIDASDASFIGSEIGIADSQLYRHLDRAFEAVEKLCRPWNMIADIYAFAWEGGHIDHDAALVIAASFAASRGLYDHLWQVPLYRASDFLPAPFFTLSSPLMENGPVVSLPLTARQRRLPRELIRFYPSQWRTFIGLGPFILWHSLTRPALKLQRAGYDRLRMRPTARPLLYECRNGISFDEFSAASAKFLGSRGIDRTAHRPLEAHGARSR